MEGKIQQKNSHNNSTRPAQQICPPVYHTDDSVDHESLTAKNSENWLIL